MKLIQSEGDTDSGRKDINDFTSFLSLSSYAKNQGVNYKFKTRSNKLWNYQSVGRGIGRRCIGS